MADLSRSVLSLRDSRRMWGSYHDNRITGLLRVCPRSGPLSWEVSHLLADEDERDWIPDLLGKATRTVANAGGLRIFLRLRQDDPLIEAARHAGFVACYHETLYEGLPGPRLEISPISDDRTWPAFRKRAGSDDHGLFRAYTAATPSEIRASVGMTLDQWMSSRERYYGRRQEIVLTKHDVVQGWLRITRRSGIGQMEGTVHPDHELSLNSLVDYGLDALSQAGQVYCLVPEYQLTLARVLSDKGFNPIGDYLTLVNSLARTIEDDARARATAASA